VKTPVIRPPEGFSPALQKALAWCPYCGEEKPFDLDSRLGYARCMGCGISERDFYVRQFNGLWSDDALDKFVRAVEKSRRKYDRPFPWETGVIVGDPNKSQVPFDPVGRTGSKCERCGKSIEAVSNRQRYCPECAKIIRREKRRKEK
jgi:hypothetical protein